MFKILPLLATLDCLVPVNSGLFDGVHVDCSRLNNGCGESQRNREGRSVIHFGLMLSFPDPLRRVSLAAAFDDGHDLAPAAYLAVEQVNNQSDLLEDYNIQISRFDGGCDSSTRTIVGINELLCSCEPIVGIIGPACEHSSRNVSQITNRKEFSMTSVNYGGSSKSVGNHPYSFGILGPNSFYNEAVVQLMKHNNWSNSALLFSDSDNGLMKLANLSGYPFRFTSAIYETFIPLKEVKDSFSRIIVILASQKRVLRVLCMAYHEGMIFPHYQWIVYEAVYLNDDEMSFSLDGRNYQCSDVELNASLNGYISLFLDAFSPDRDTAATTTAGVTVEEYHKSYVQRTVWYSNRFGVESIPSEWANAVYDAVWVLALALNNSVIDLDMSLSEYKVGSQVLAESVRKHMLELDIHGITGRIKFDALGYNKEGVLNLFQYGGQSNTSKKIGYFMNKEIHLLENVSTFIDATFRVQYVQISVGAASGLMVFTAFSLMIVITAQVVNVCYRNHKVIKASSPSLNHLIFLGCYAIIIGIVFHMLETLKEIDVTAKTWFCNIVPCFLNVGVTLILGTVCFKTLRLNQIYMSSKRLHKGNIKCAKNYFIIGFVSILVVLDANLCVIWHVVDPLTPVRSEQLEIIEDELVKTVKDVCTSEYTIYWLISFLSPKVLLTLASFSLAISTRMDIKEFKTNNVAILTYLLTLIFGLGIPIYMVFFFSDISLSIRVTVLVACLNVSVFVCVLVLFLPFIRNMKNCTKLAHDS